MRTAMMGAYGTDAWVVETLRNHEPEAVRNQIPIVWDRAAGSRIYDSQGRSWLDWTSGILTANAGHAPASVTAAIERAARHGLLHSYMFPTAVRARVVEALVELSGLQQVVLLTTGSEAVEATLKISRRHALARGRSRALVISFDGAFHGRTMGAQLTGGGLAGGRSWTGDGDDIFVRLPFPADDAIQTWSDSIDAALSDRNATPRDVACVVIEIYQGSTMRVLSESAARDIGTWCDHNGVILVVDEMQSGFGRTGPLFAYERLAMSPDIVICGKGLSGSLPVSAVLIRDPQVTETLRPGELTTTHGANPICLAAAEANLELFRDGSLLHTATERAGSFARRVLSWAARDPDTRHIVNVIGLVAGIRITDTAANPDPGSARRLVEECAARGLLLCAPARQHGGALIKAMPPLTTTEEELDDAFAIFTNAADAVDALSEPTGGAAREQDTR